MEIEKETLIVLNGIQRKKLIFGMVTTVMFVAFVAQHISLSYI
jgi:hypothetical protein